LTFEIIPDDEMRAVLRAAMAVNGVNERPSKRKEPEQVDDEVSKIRAEKKPRR
jgi:hypothetical protein